MIKIAFIGAGNMASAHAKAFCDIPDVEFVGVYSRSQEKAEIFKDLHKIDQRFETIEALYTFAKPNILIVAVNELSLAALCPSIFLYPWFILVEKPVGYNFEDALYILEMAKRHSAKVFVALNRRHYSSTNYLLGELEKTSLSRVVEVFDQEAPSIARLEGTPEIVLRNYAYANSIHLIDYFSFLCRGKIVDVRNVVSIENYNLSILNYSSGDVGVYSCHWDCPAPWAITVTSSDRRWELRPIENLSYQNFGSREVFPVETSEWDKNFKPGLRRQASEMVKIAKGGSGSVPTIQEAFESVELIRQIYGA